MNIKAKPVAIKWQKGISIYASEAFLREVSDEYGWLGGFDEKGETRCILPYTVIRKGGVRLVRFRSETISLHHELGIEEEKAFLNSVVDHFRAAGADIIVPATNNAIFRTYPDGAVAVPYGTYVIDLTQPEETLWTNLHPKHRNVVRSAGKKGVEVRSGVQYLETAHQLVSETLKRSRLRFMPLPEFRRLVLGLEENVRILLAFHDGVPQGCAVVPFSAYSAYYLYGGSVRGPVSGAINFLQWESIRMFRELGVQRYDFVGVRIDPDKDSKQEGLKVFKERFGGALVRGYMWKYPFHPLRSALYSLAVRVVKGGDVVDQELRRLAANEP